MGKDYIPAGDADFDIFQDNFIAGVQPNLDDWDILNAEFSVLQDLQNISRPRPPRHNYIYKKARLSEIIL